MTQGALRDPGLWDITPSAYKQRTPRVFVFTPKGLYSKAQGREARTLGSSFAEAHLMPLLRTLALLFLLAFAPPAFAQPSVAPAEPYKAAVAELEKLIKH